MNLSEEGYNGVCDCGCDGFGSFGISWLHTDLSGKILEVIYDELI